MAMRALPTADMLNKLLEYSPMAGQLIWRERGVNLFTSGHFTADTNCRRWNARYAGKLAGTPNPKGYIVVKIFGLSFYAQRIIWMMVFGRTPEQVDHISGDTSNNRLSNLRDVTCQQNACNATRSRNSTSGVTGVSWSKGERKWFSHIRYNGKKKRLGSFADFGDAVAARKKAEHELKFHPNHGRSKAH